MCYVVYTHVYIYIGIHASVLRRPHALYFYDSTLLRQVLSGNLEPGQWSVSLNSIPDHSSIVLRLQLHHVAMSGFYTGGGDVNPSPHACTSVLTC